MLHYKENGKKEFRRAHPVDGFREGEGVVRSATDEAKEAEKAKQEANQAAMDREREEAKRREMANPAVGAFATAALMR